MTDRGRWGNWCCNFTVCILFHRNRWAWRNGSNIESPQKQFNTEMISSYFCLGSESVCMNLNEIRSMTIWKLSWWTGRLNCKLIPTWRLREVQKIFKKEDGCKEKWHLGANYERRKLLYFLTCSRGHVSQRFLDGIVWFLNTVSLPGEC